jgi:hypothetical protein
MSVDDENRIVDNLLQMSMINDDPQSSSFFSLAVSFFLLSPVLFLYIFITM